MRKATGVIQFFKKYCIEVLLTISALLICFVHAIPAGLNADFWPINGDFQNYNVVRRFLDGQTIYKDFVACILRAPAVADALTTGRGAVIERSAGGAGQDCL